MARSLGSTKFAVFLLQIIGPTHLSGWEDSKFMWCPSINSRFCSGLTKPRGPTCAAHPPSGTCPELSPASQPNRGWMQPTAWLGKVRITEAITLMCSHACVSHHCIDKTVTVGSVLLSPGCVTAKAEELLHILLLLKLI